MITDALQESLLKHYFNTGHSYNELLGEDGELRPHWKTFFASFGQLGPDEIRDKSQDIYRLLKENGVTYTIYGDPSGQSRPWSMDIIPFLISKTDWDVIESGLRQRAELFNLILEDIYGQRQLIKNGLLPVELIYNHPGFLRQCVGIKQSYPRSLILYAADMARSPDGKIWVLNDRTQAPSGSGYALENRIAMARILPELFHGLDVRQLSSYFSALASSLQEIAPDQKQNPRIVILTPGLGNETYFEHSYLSSYLGYTLVQGDDLMVRDNYVWLKTISGLEKVDVILRRVDDVYCDPLELKEDSQLGIPGLLQVVRSGNVTIANPLGSSVMENPGLMSFLQNIARHFLNEDLILPTIATWWCGQPKELKYVLDNIQSLVIKRIYKESNTSTSVDASSYSQKDLQELKERIRAHPYLYVGQERVSFSSSPCLVNGKIEPRNTLFRSFLVSGREGYTAMTGGLTRTAARPGHFIISNQSGGTSKDTWVISPEQGLVLNTRRELLSNQPAASRTILPSYTAENLFWVGRYAERVLGSARFQRSVMQFLVEGNRLLPGNEAETEQHLLRALTHYTCTYPGFVGEENESKFFDPWTELRDIVFNQQRPGTISFNFLLLGRAIYHIRDLWSIDTWRLLQDMQEEWRAAASSNLTHFRMENVLDDLITSMVAFIGLNRETISRDQGWSMLDIGRKMEQSLLLISMLRSTLVNTYDEQVAYNLQESVLKSNETLVNYRYKYRVHIQLPLVLELMLLDSNNPRSLIYQLDRLKAYLAGLPKPPGIHALPEHEKLILEAHTMVKLADKETLSALDERLLIHKNLDDFLSKAFELLSGIPNAISKIFFKHAQFQKQLYTSKPVRKQNSRP